MSQFCKVDDEIEFSILKVESNNRRIRLSIKNLESNPWQSLKKKYHKGSVVTGTISNVTDFGVFVKIDEDIEGLISKFNLVGPNVEYKDSILENYKVGDEITSMIVEINVQTQKLTLSIKEMIKKSEESDMAKYMADTKEDDDTFSLADLLKTKETN